MIKVKLRVILDLVDIFQAKEVEYLLEDVSKISDVFKILTNKYGEAFTNRIHIDTNNTQNSEKDVYLFLNGRNIIFLQGINTDLKDGDDLFFLPPAGGG